MALTLSRRVWLLLGFFVVLGIVLLYLNGRRPPNRVTVVQVRRENLVSMITSNGKVEPVNPYSLRARSDAFVNSVSVTEGQAVRAGQLLLTLANKDLQAQLDESKAQLASEEDELRAAQAGGRPDKAAQLAGDLRAAESQRDLLQRQREALTKLLAQKAATQDELERNRSALDRANADVEQLRKAKQEFERQASVDRERLGLVVSHTRAQVAEAQTKLAGARVVAPVAGTLFSLPVHAGDFVHTGDLLADVADLHQVRVRAYVDEPELGKLAPNQAVQVTWNALPDRTWMGRTLNVPRQVVARGARSVGEVLCSVSNEHLELIPNTTVDVRIQISEHQNVLTIPRGAVQIQGAHRYIYRVDDDRIHRAEIKVGMSDAANYEVLGGVQDGAVIALPGEAPLKDNMVVRTVSPQ